MVLMVDAKIVKVRLMFQGAGETKHTVTRLTSNGIKIGQNMFLLCLKKLKSHRLVHTTFAYTTCRPCK